MPSPKSHGLGRTRAVLYAGPGVVEWFEHGPEGEDILGQAQVLGPGPGDLARACADLVRSLGRRPRECVLVLADGLLHQRVLSLPRLPDGELRAALRRKAANSSGAKERAAVFGALHLGLDLDESASIEGQVQKWLLVAHERAYLHGLQVHLRRRGFWVRRVTPMRLVALGHSSVVETSQEGGRVVVGLGPDSAILSLIQKDCLVHQTILAGRLGPGSSLAMTLIQELRGLDLYWRKLSRGQSIAEVVLVGLEPGDSASLGPALCAALPGTRALLFPEPDSLHPRAGRAEALAAALRSGPWTLDLSVPLAPRPLALAAVTAVLGLGAMSAGLLGVDQLEDRRLEWQEAGGIVRELAQDLPAVKRELSARETALANVTRRRERLGALDRLGLPLEDMLLDLALAFDGRGQLTTLAMTATPSGLQVDATGETSADPLLGYAALEDLRRTLEASPHFRAVKIMPPASLPEAFRAQGGDTPRLSFSLQATREVRL